jgi:AsmA protein
MTNRSPSGGPPPHTQDYYYPNPHPGRPGDPRRRPPERRQTSPVLLGLIYGGIGILALAAFAITFVIIAPPTDLIRREIVQQVKSATGRDLTIAGPASFTFFPTIGLSLADVSLSAPPGMGGAPLVTARSFDIGVRLLPLLQKEIVVDRLVLNKPVIDLRVDGQGRRSWDMAAAESSRPVRLAQATPDDGTLRDFSPGIGIETGAVPAAPRLGDISEISLGDIRIVDGTVCYSDARDGANYQADAVNAHAGLNSIALPLDAEGSLEWAREKVDFKGTLTSPRDLIEQRPAKLVVNLSGAPVTLGYDGSVKMGEAIDAQGAVDGKAASLRALARWLGTELPPTPGFGAATFAGDLRVREHAVRLTNANLSLDGATAIGTIEVTTGGTRPHVEADLRVADLRLDNYLADDGVEGLPQAAPPPVAAPPPAAASPGSPQSIEDLLDQPGPRVKGFTQRAGWNNAALDLASLGQLDADARLAVTGLSYGKIRMDSAQLVVGLKDRVLKTTFADVKLYQGRGNGLVMLDATGPEAVLGANMQLDAIAAEPLLKDASGIDWLAGTGNATLALSGRGNSQAAIVGSLNGKADIAVRNGAIIGFNLGGAMRAVSQGKVPDFDSSPSERTDFSELTGSFVITDGIARNDDLRLAGPLLRAGGSGIVDLPQRSLDYTMRPKLVATRSGQGGEQNLAGLEIPLHITGPWDRPSVSADIAGAINNPGTMEAVKELGKQFKGKSAGEVVEDLFGESEDGEPSKAERLLQKFLGK